MLLTPGVIVAIDDFGWDVAARIGSLLRSLIRGPNHQFARALRDRFRFMRLVAGGELVYSEVQSVAVDPSERLWNLADSNWRYPTFTAAETGPFIATLQRTIAGDPGRGVRGVLEYAEDEELLREHGLLIQPGRLNIFFVGALVPEVPIDDILMEQFIGGAQPPPLMSPLDREVGLVLDRLRDAAERVRNLARESHSLDLVARGAFLSLELPADNYTFARLSLGAHGNTLGRLLTPPPAAEYAAVVGYEEPPLHFCSLYGQHDERGTAYDRRQIANLMSNAICSLLLSELLDNETCATQLGLRNPYAKTYERLVTISALRSSTVKSEIVDYAGFQYGAHLLDALFPPDMTKAPSPAERAYLQPQVDRLINAAGLAELIADDDQPLWDHRGAPTRLSRLVSDGDVGPPDLAQLVPEPRVRVLDWGQHAATTLDQLERLNDLGDILASGPSAGSAGILPHFPDGRPYTACESKLVHAWREWRRATAQRIEGADERGEVRHRLLAIVHELDRRLWDAPAAGSAASGARYGFLLIGLALRHMQAVEQGIAQRGGLDGPGEEEIEAELQNARRRSQARMELAPIVALSVLLLILSSYLVIGAYGSAISGWLSSVARQAPLTWRVPGINLSLGLPTPLFLADLLALATLGLGLTIRQIQTLKATLAIRTYARLVRQKLAIALYREERAYARTLLGDLRDYLSFLQQYLNNLHAESQQIANTFRQRAATIAGAEQRRDVAEYSRVTAESPAALYRAQVAPRLNEMLRTDLPLVRREAAQIWGFAEGLQPERLAATPAEHPVVHATDPGEIARRASAALHRLTLGDSQASEQESAARLRYIAYQGVARELHSAAGRLAPLLDRNLARALRERARLMVRSGLAPGDTPNEVNHPYEQEYYLSVVEGIGDAPELSETVQIRAVSEEISWFVRVANRIWPRLLEGARVRL